jgi:nitrogen fixation protein NifB
MSKLTVKDFHRHPCFNVEAKGKYGRVHLPVAPKCNIKCNFCDRKYDCVNESRPGVTSTLLSPQQAEIYMGKDPGEGAADLGGRHRRPRRPLRQSGRDHGHPATDQKKLSRYPALRLLQRHGHRPLYRGPGRDRGLPCNHHRLRGRSGHRRAYLLLGQRQQCRLPGTAGGGTAARTPDRRHPPAEGSGITVKVNCIVIPGINDQHVEAVAARMRELGADLLNCMAMFPNVNTPFAEIPQPDKKTMTAIRDTAEQYLPQMRHCTRCRADAVGLLGEDRTDEFRGCLSACSTIAIPPGELRPYVAVASQEGILINQHLGEARSFQIWESPCRFLPAGRRAPGPGQRRRHHPLAQARPDPRRLPGRAGQRHRRDAARYPDEVGGRTDRGLGIHRRGPLTDL